MLKISFISAGTTSSQTPIMATLAYELVKRWMKDQPQEIPDFPLACIFDFSNMYTTIQFFASDKILMRMGELTSITKEMKESQTLDWSKCSFPSKFVHKDTNEPLFFMIPVFERGMTSTLSKSDTLELTQHILKISESVEKAGTKYMFYDLPLIEARQQRFFEIAALLNSNMVLGVVDLNKVSVDKVISEIKTLEVFLDDYSMFAEPGLKLNGLVFNKVSEKTLSEKWVEKVMESFPYPVVGMVREDPEFTKIIPRYELPTVDSQFHKMKCAKDFQSATEMILQIISDSSSLRVVTSSQYQDLENKIFSS